MAHYVLSPASDGGENKGSNYLIAALIIADSEKNLKWIPNTQWTNPNQAGSDLFVFYSGKPHFGVVIPIGN